MSPRLSRRRTVIAVASAAAVIGATLFTGTATAATNAEPVSTAVPIVTPDGMLMSYILNTAKDRNPGQVQVLSNAVRKAGGVVVQSWPADRRRRGPLGPRRLPRPTCRRRRDRRSSPSARPGRVSVSRGHPRRDLEPCGRPGASVIKKGAKKDYNGDLPTEETPAAAVDPREGSSGTCR